ncbi:DUF934 domain-containing protein [Methylomonas sp. MgM2]
MPIIKDQRITENTWTFIADDSPLANGDITVTLDRWTRDKEQLLKHESQVGVRLMPGDNIDILNKEDFNAIKLIELDFPVFADGRLFSLASLIRSKHGYHGEIRAVGNYMTDQVFYLHRVGVDAFELSETKDIERVLSALNDFSVCYQPSIN